jgi:hypothetical protein
MEDQDTTQLPLTVHSVYGAIYQDGEFVQRGAVLGLSVDARAVVIAPVSGWVRLLPGSETASGISLKIDSQPAGYMQPQGPAERRD